MYGHLWASMGTEKEWHDHDWSAEGTMSAEETMNCAGVLLKAERALNSP